MTQEELRLEEDKKRIKYWKKWGPYLSERQWGTVREDYSPDGNAWDYFPFKHSHLRAYRWGEDGIAGISDNHAYLCFSPSFWNGNDEVLKERLFGLTNGEGNHGEDVKELYYYLESTPTHSYMKHLYKYPQKKFPYEELLTKNQELSREDKEYELIDTGVFDENNYFDIYTEYAKADEEDILIKITVHNRSENTAPIWILPTLWFRNLWDCKVEKVKPFMQYQLDDYVKLYHSKLGDYYFYYEEANQVLFTENETNTKEVFDYPNKSPYTKDAFNRVIVNGEKALLKDKKGGTKTAVVYHKNVEGKGSYTVKLRLSKQKLENPLRESFDEVFANRLQENEEFYSKIHPAEATVEEKNIQRQAFAGVMWTKQFYGYDVRDWFDGDKGLPTPPKSRKYIRNKDWRHLNNYDIISMPDKWEYPWYAVWDLAFHCSTIARIDSDFAKHQLLLVTKEWYMHPNGQIPAYEWNFSDVNPPVHAWSALQVYNIEKEKTGKGDIRFLKKIFHKLLLNFTWWINQKDSKGNNVFEGGFLGLDNIGVFDRSHGVPKGGLLEQADGTSWMAMYSLNMMDIALEIAMEDDAYEDVCTKFFEHFVYISESFNKMGHDWISPWDEQDGFFYDLLALPDDTYIPVKVRSVVGLISIFATTVISKEKLQKLQKFKKGINWFYNYRKNNDLYDAFENADESKDLLLSLVSKDKLKRLLSAMLDENEFLSKGGIRSLSKIHKKGYVLELEEERFELKYEPGESLTGLYGGNSNWRGPVWFPINFLLIQSIHNLFEYYRYDLFVEFPTLSNNYATLKTVSKDLTERLINIFKRDNSGNRPVNDEYSIYKDEYFKDLILFYEFFHGDNARGIGASHQTGWTALVADLIHQKYN
ncbi:MAG: glucosidase [Flavobacteriales bacterium]|nr:glucosidase [Flavobacteriales bacterium]